MNGISIGNLQQPMVIMLQAASRYLDGNNAARVNVLLAASRYLAAHSPTMSSQDRTYQIANQLHKGEQLFEEIT